MKKIVLCVLVAFVCCSMVAAAEKKVSAVARTKAILKQYRSDRAEMLKEYHAKKKALEAARKEFEAAEAAMELWKKELREAKFEENRAKQYSKNALIAAKKKAEPKAESKKSEPAKPEPKKKK
jgi:Skp family chaperone for outer membrane proteins